MTSGEHASLHVSPSHQLVTRSARVAPRRRTQPAATHHG
jgi:hypothetical protein